MATAPTNSFLAFDGIGNREDLSDVIYNIAPDETPGLSAFEAVDASAVLHEWQTDTLAAAAQNAVPEGEDATTDAVTATTRLTNRLQISDKVARVSGTQQAVAKAGRRDELEYQIAKKGKELKRDMENDIFSNNAAVTGSDGTAREFGGVPAWITTNTSNGTSGTDGSIGTTARTDGTQRAFTESLLKTVLAAAWDAGGDPDCVMVGSFNKQTMSTFTGNATREISASGKNLIATIDLYTSDFGTITVKPNRFSRSRDALVLQTDMWAIAYLRSFRSASLAKTGDTEREQIVVEYTLESRNEAASGAVWDLTTS